MLLVQVKLPGLINHLKSELYSLLFLSKHSILSSQNNEVIPVD